MYRSQEVTVGDKLISNQPRELFFSTREGAVPVTSIVHECKVRFQRDAVPKPLKGYVCHRLFSEGKQSKTHGLKDRNFQTETQMLVDLLLTEAANQALDELEIQQAAFDCALHLPLVHSLAHHLHQLSSLTTMAPELPLHHLEQLVDLRRRSLAPIIKSTDAVCLHALHHHPTHRPLATLFVWLDQLKDSNPQLQREELAADILSAVGNLPVGAKDILQMSGDAANEIPSTLPRWGTLMRSFLRDGQLLGRAVAEQARALMHRWKAIFQGKMDVVRPVHIKQLGPPPEQPRVELSPVTPHASTPQAAAQSLKRKQPEGELTSPIRTTRASGPVLSPRPTHKLGLKSIKVGSLIKFTTAEEAETPSARRAEQAGMETEQADPPMPTPPTTTAATATTSSSSGSDSTHRMEFVSDPNRGDGAGTAHGTAEWEASWEKIAEVNLQNMREELVEKETERRQALTREGDAVAVAAAAAAAAAAADADAVVAAVAAGAGNAMSEPTWESFELSAISGDECSLHVESGHDQPAAKHAESSSDSDETSSSSDDSDDDTPAAKAATPAKPAAMPAEPESERPTRKAPWTKAQSDLLNDALKGSLEKQLRTPDGDVLKWLVVNLNHLESRKSVTIDDIKVWYKHLRAKLRRALAATQAGRHEAPKNVAAAAKEDERKALVPNTTKAKAARKETKSTAKAALAAMEIIVKHPGGVSKKFRVVGGLLDLEGTFNKECKNPGLRPALMDSSHTLLLPVECSDAVRVKHNEVYTLFFMPKLAPHNP